MERTLVNQNNTEQIAKYRVKHIKRQSNKRKKKLKKKYMKRNKQRRMKNI